MRAWLAVVSVVLIVSGQIVSGGHPYFDSCKGLTHLVLGLLLFISGGGLAYLLAFLAPIIIIVIWLIVYVGLLYTLISCLVMGFTRASNAKASRVVAVLFAVLALLTFTGLVSPELFPNRPDRKWNIEPPFEFFPWYFFWPCSFGSLSLAYAVLSKRRLA